MSTIPDTMRIIARDIQCVFEELIKLLIRKSLRPALNPLGANTKIVYNNYRGRYERGYIGSSPDDNISKYTYTMTNESLGWTEEVLTNFKVMAKFIKNSTVPRFPTMNTKNHNQIKSKSRVAFSDREGKQHIINGRVPSITQYKNFISILSSRTMQNVIANKKASFTYTTDVPYTHSFKELETIGRDIIDQTDPSICGEDSAKMSTSMLRVKLYNLEDCLANLSIEHPNIYDAYISMMCIINSVPRNKMVWVINLIAAMTYQRWCDFSPNQKQCYLETLGEDFVAEFNDNELITILLQSDSSELILTCSYLYSLLKMLFIVFGYSKLVPIITDNCNESSQEFHKDRMRKHLEKYRGASHRRADNSEMIICEEGPICGPPCGPQFGPQFGPPCGPQFGPQCGGGPIMTDEFGNPTTIVNTCDGSTIMANNPGCYGPVDPCDDHVDVYEVDPEPVDQCIYDYIKLFGELYPTIIGLMGGTETFPPETTEIGCNDIPPTYEELNCLPEYLWRFNDYSYCRYLEYVSSKQLGYALNAKINSKARYLHSI